MKRSSDTMLGITKKDEFATPDTHLDEKNPEVDQLRLTQSDRERIAISWIQECDPQLLCPDQTYGNDKKPIGRFVAGLLSSIDCSAYYKLNLAQKYSDIELCQNVCPVFILHNIAALLRQRPLSNGHISYYWQYILHILKFKLVEANKPIGSFISRLFDLVYDNGITPYEIPEVYLNIITIFLHENLHFMTKQQSPPLAPNPVTTNQHYYSLSSESIENPVFIIDIVVNNLLPSYFIVTESHSEAIKECGLSAQNESIAIWNKYQSDRGTMREMQLFTGNQCSMPQKKVREALKTVRFSDDVSVVRYSCTYPVYKK